MFDLHPMHPRRVALGSDECTPTTDFLSKHLGELGFEVVLLGALSSGVALWSQVGRAVGEQVAEGKVAFGVVCCWTGTGVSIAANKVRGIRAALCCDAPTAAGARTWNDANVLALSLRLTTPALAQEILVAWLDARMSEAADDRLALGLLQD